jgi:hypothetical protein
MTRAPVTRESFHGIMRKFDAQFSGLLPSHGAARLVRDTRLVQAAHG